MHLVAELRFYGKNRQSVKLLRWDTDGFVLYQKRLEKGTFEIPAEIKDKLDEIQKSRTCCPTVSCPRPPDTSTTNGRLWSTSSREATLHLTTISSNG